MQDWSASGAQWTGATALTAYALICTGDTSHEPHVAAAIDFLRKNRTHGSYSLGVRCLLWSSIKLDAATRAIAQKDLTDLIHSMHSVEPARGLYSYTPPAPAGDTQYDMSVSQIAMLGIWSMARKGFEVPDKLFTVADQAWRSHQAADGGWSYCPALGKDDHPESMAMTAAGVATLLITQQNIHASAGGCNPLPRDPNITRGLQWMAANFDVQFDQVHGGGAAPEYTWFGISRIAAIGGFRTIGSVDWYSRGTDFMLRLQQPDGQWTGWLGTPSSHVALGILFMEYGHGPVVLNKLQYTTTDAPNRETWNLRPGDAYNFAQWFGDQLEERLNWQVVSLDTTSPEDMHSAPILYITGDKPLDFSKADLAKLKEFVEQGGMIVGNADCGSEPFSASFIKLGLALFPEYEFRPLPADHEIFHQNFAPATVNDKIRLQGLSNGVRELMILPGADMGRFMQRGESLMSNDYFSAFGDIASYASDKKNLREKGVTYIVTPDASVTADRTIKLARLKYAGNRDPEPAGWRRLSAILHNDCKLDLTVGHRHPRLRRP